MRLFCHILKTTKMAANRGIGRDAYIEAYRRLGSKRAVARELGVTKSTVQEVLRGVDPAVQAGMDRLGMTAVPGVAWIKTKPKDDEPGYSFMVRLQADDDQLERIRDAFDGMDAAPKISPPPIATDDLLTVYPIADLHLGMMAWGRETGEDYDTGTAAKRAMDWVGRCVASSPPSKTGVILSVGDYFHADDQTNQTPASKHQLDVDTRHFKTLEVGIQAMDACIQLALGKHSRVIVRVLAGNHDPHSSIALTFAIAERYRNEPRVEVVKDPSAFWVHEFGKVMLAATHGDKAKADRIVHFMADQYAETWGRTKHRALFTGHLHNTRAQDIGGVKHEQLRAVTARDAYAFSHAYCARAQLQAITYHKTDGEVQRVSVNA